VLELVPFSQRKVRNASNVGYRIGFEPRSFAMPNPTFRQMLLPLGFNSIDINIHGGGSFYSTVSFNLTNNHSG